MKGKYIKFSNRLIDAMIAKGHSASRSPKGICIKTLAQFAGASEQICRRYIRGDALPDYDKVINIAACLKVLPGWLLFGEQHPGYNNHLDDELMHYILRKSHALYQNDPQKMDDYADFVMELIHEIRKIDTSKENLEKIVNLTLTSIYSYHKKLDQKMNSTSV